MKAGCEHVFSLQEKGRRTPKVTPVIRTATPNTGPECRGQRVRAASPQFQRMGPLFSRATWAGLHQAGGMSVCGHDATASLGLEGRA